MKLSSFIFPTASEPSHDAAVIDDALEEIRLSEELGMDAIWLAEHHFDGMCAYADPVVFAAALARALSVFCEPVSKIARTSAIRLQADAIQPTQLSGSV